MEVTPTPDDVNVAKRRRPRPSALPRGGLVAAPGLAVACLAACAIGTPGIDVPTDQLHFPIALERVGDRLIVLNTNFDRRYTGGSVAVLSIPALLAAAAAGLPEGAAPVVVRDPPGAFLGVEQVPSFGSHLATRARADGGRDVFVLSRGEHSVTWLDLQGDTLTCNPDGVAPWPGTDCAPGRIADTGFLDPASLLVLDDVGAEGSLLVAHARATPDGVASLIAAETRLGVVDLATFRAGFAASSTQSFARVVSNAPRRGGYLTLVRTATPGVVLAGTGEGTLSEPALVGDAALTPLRLSVSAGTLAVDPEAPVAVGSLSSAASTRGLVIDPSGRRAYATLRMRQATTRGGASGEPRIYNSIVATVDLRTRAVLGLVELGSELGALYYVPRPAPLRPLLYAPDHRTGELLVLDAGGALPELVAIVGERREGAKTTTPAFLRVTTDLEWVESGGKTFVFATNFGNSTLALLDVSDADPRKHRVVARFGRAIGDDGLTEAP